MPRAAEEWAHAFLFTDCRIPYTSENHGSLLSKERNAMRKDTFAPVPKSLVAGSKEPFCYTQEETHMKPDGMDPDCPLQASGFQVPCGSLPGRTGSGLGIHRNPQKVALCSNLPQC